MNYRVNLCDLAKTELPVKANIDVFMEITSLFT